MNKELNSINDLIKERDNFLEKDIDLFKNLDDLNYSERIKVLKQNCKNFDYFYEKLLEFYKTYTLKGLSEATGIPITTFSSIKQRKSISALKKKCMELNIYSEIFGDLQKIKSIDDLKIENSKNDIQITTINDKRILYFFETLFKDCKLNNKLKELEDDIKNLILKYNPKISINNSKKTTTDLFFEFLEKNIN